MQFSKLACILLFSSFIRFGTSCLDDDSTVFSRNGSVNAAPSCPMARDCKEWQQEGMNISGVYPVKPDDGAAFQVYCDMATDGGGWTVFQYRFDGSVDFYRPWAEYENGFGHLRGEFWLGLSKVHRLLKVGEPYYSYLTGTIGDNHLRVDLEDFDAKKYTAKYTKFGIGDVTSKYTLTVSGFSGNAGNSLAVHNGKKFSTYNADNDGGRYNCASKHKGAWWYYHDLCYTSSYYGSNLNGIRLRTPGDTAYVGMEWIRVRAASSMKGSKMMFRRVY